MQAMLKDLQIVGGVKTPLFNRGKPKTKPVTKADLRRWRYVTGRIVAGCWEAVVDGVAVVARVQTKG